MIQYGRKVATYAQNALRQVAARYAPPKKKDRQQCKQQCQDDSLVALAVQVSILKDKVDPRVWPARPAKDGSGSKSRPAGIRAEHLTYRFPIWSYQSDESCQSQIIPLCSAFRLAFIQCCNEACDMHTLGMPMPYAYTASLIARYNNGT